MVKRLSFLVFLFSIADADAASFNCNYAKRTAEVFVCQNTELSKLDELTVERFSYIRNRSERSDAPRNLKKNLDSLKNQWIAWRNSCGRDFYCIKTTYEEWGRGMDKLMGISPKLIR